MLAKYKEVLDSFFAGEDAKSLFKIEHINYILKIQCKVLAQYAQRDAQSCPEHTSNQ